MTFLSVRWNFPHWANFARVRRARRSPRRDPGELPRVLVAEPNPVVRRLLVRLLGGRGHEVAEAGDLAGCLAILGGSAVDIVALDPLLPGVGHPATMDRVRQATTSLLALVPASGPPPDLCWAFDDILARPIRPAKLFAVIDCLGSAPRDPLAVLSSTLKAVVENDRPFLIEIIALFDDEAPRLVARLRDALDRGDAVALTLAAHSLKGTLGHFGESRALALARRLEARASVAELESNRSLIAALDGELGRLRGLLGQI